MKYSFLIFLILLSMVCYSQKNYSGIYKTNFPGDGIYTNILTLNCDSSMIFQIVSDSIQYNNYGKWATSKEGISIVFDSINYPNQLYKGERNFRSKKNQLYQINIFPKEQYNKLVQESENISNANNIQIPNPSYRILKKAFSLTTMNKNGDKAIQFYQQTKVFDCNID